MKTYIFAYNQNSKSARLLAKALNIQLIRHENSRFQPRRSKTVINWGASTLPEHVRGTQVVNHPDAVHDCANKLSFFEAMTDGPRVVEWTTDPEQVVEWVSEQRDVLARTSLTGHSGEGIVFLDEYNVGEYLDAPLFTVYKPKKEEYRIHVFNGRVIDTQQKLLRKSDDNGTPIDPARVDFRVRNLASGFIFGRNGINPDKDVIDQAVSAYRKSGLTFGAVDVIWNEKERRAYVLEINSAPGLEGTTVEKYTSAFQEFLASSSTTSDSSAGQGY